MKRNILIVDFNSLFIRVATKQYAVMGNNYGIDSLRNAIINDIESAKSFTNSNEVVITLEGKREMYWKLDVYPYYKADRDKKKSSGIDFNKYIYPYMDELLKEIRAELPYVVIKNLRCESDDIIASIVIQQNMDYDHMFILTLDSDFNQLVERYKNVYAGFPDSYSRIFTMNKPNDIPMLHKVIKGSAKDFIPNAYTDNEFLYSKLMNPELGGKQESVTKKVLESLGDKPKMADVIAIFPHFKRNYDLMAMIKIPEDVQLENIAMLDIARSEVNPDANIDTYKMNHRMLGV